MAAPMKIPVLSGLSNCLRPCMFSARFLSSRRDGRKGPPPWAARQVPTGYTFYAQMLSKVQNREIWKKRMDYVNRPWKRTVLDYNKRKAALADTPPEEPHKLLMVRQRGNLWGVPKDVKKTLKLLGIKEQDKIVILKNKEYNIKYLKKVNHLIEVLPITFPYGLPESDEDLDHCYITDNGQFIVKKKLESLQKSDENLPVSAEKVENKFEMKQEYIDKIIELRKMKYQMHQQYFQTKYIYERNQDGKEFRYKDSHDIGYDKIWH